MTNPFNSFWWGGFECTDHLNAFGHRVDFLQRTGHLAHLVDDYKLLAPLGLGTVREGIRWSKVEHSPYQYDWDQVNRVLLAGQRLGVQQVWDLCHFGYPDDLTPLHPLFTQRFTALCVAFVKNYRKRCPTGRILVTPIVEASFISWLGGEVNGTVPYCEGQGGRVKYALMKAYIAGVQAMKVLDAAVVIVAAEPLTYAAPRLSSIPFLDATQNLLHAEHYNECQFEAMDMLTGRRCPELGGRPEYLDVLGLNYYWRSQHELGGEPLSWFPNDARRQPLTHLMEWAYARYGVPLVLAETGHFGEPEHRARWVREIGVACRQLIGQGIPLWGCCLYPVLDRTDWDHLEQDCHRPGLFDAADVRDAASPRVLCEPVANALQDSQQLVALAQRHHPEIQIA